MAEKFSPFVPSTVNLTAVTAATAECWGEGRKFRGWIEGWNVGD
jgi:hypothetical protein